MLFNSYIFWAFYAVVFVLYRWLPHNGQNWLLLAASYVFYGYWDVRFLLLMIATTAVDYGVGLCLDAERFRKHRKAVLVVSICANLGVLGFFKYYGFFAREFAALMANIGLSSSLPVLNVVLPVGISFYTFQSMSYTIDVYRREVAAVKSLRDFALYVAFFPQLVAGPIERSSNLIPQVIHPRHPHPGQFWQGLYDVATGLFRKVVIADNLAPVANTIFQTDPSRLSGMETLIGVYAFAFQIYCDFSGYSAIARGTARWMGFDLMENFHMPYFAVSPSDFWKRWHISLSSWLRDYLYIPLGGNRGGEWKTARNLMLTMILGGLWHGAAWTFIAWGTIHGLMLVAFKWYDGWRLAGRPLSPMARAGRIVLMFHLVCVTWLLFRASSLTQAWAMFTTIFTNFHVTPFAVSCATLVAFFAIPLLLIDWFSQQSHDPGSWLAHRPLAWQSAALSYLLLMVTFFPPSQVHEFIYFQF
jgi:D-alanyl-lipoteichoic acid acyltransferase DltB (MBOAT superfamily)